MVWHSTTRRPSSRLRCPPQTGSPSEANAKTTQIQLLGLNDFHGNLEPPSGSGGRIGQLTGPATPPNLCVVPTCYLAGGAE